MTKYDMQRSKALSVIELLQKTYPDATCGLRFSNAWQLLAATILSAQCTDNRVNRVTQGLFAVCPDPASTAIAETEDIEKLIRSTGFFRNKAKSLIGSAQKIMKHHNGRVPNTMSELVALPGVGRKTANVVLGNVYGIPGMVVDTHVGRISRRLGWTTSLTAEAIEKDLCHLLPRECWTQTSHLLIFHGRNCCRAQTAWCSGCPIDTLCPKIDVIRRR